MNSVHLLLIIIGYFGLLMLISWWSSRTSGSSSYFDGDRTSPWYLVAFGMIGSGISAVSLVSIPGNVFNQHLYFFQFILGTIAGYVFIAFVLVPVFHRMQLVSIYGYLRERFGITTYRTGSAVFLISQSFGAALRLLLSIRILHDAFFQDWGVPPAVLTLGALMMIWLYTHRSGIKTIVRTDALQSFFLITVIVVSIASIERQLDLNWTGLWQVLTEGPKARWIDTDPSSGTHFLKQFFSGFLITVALVGLDQSMMQKTLTIARVNDARRNVLTFSLFIAGAQTLFLILGVLLWMFMEKAGIQWSTSGGGYTNTDGIYPYLTTTYFGATGTIAFFIGVVASTFATVDTCITALTTAVSYDFFGLDRSTPERRSRLKRWILLAVNTVIFLLVLIFWNSGGAIIDTVFTVAGYTAGPLLGLFTAGLFTRIRPAEKRVPVVCITAPLFSWLLGRFSSDTFGFDFGFLHILSTAAITWILLWMIRENQGNNINRHTEP